MKKNNHKPTMSRITEARKDGQYVRAKVWSKEGKDKCPKKLRRRIKNHLNGF